MGESKRKRLGASESGKSDNRRAVLDEPLLVDTLGGRVHVQWDTEANATPNGQLVFFAQYLSATGVFERWVEESPLCYNSPNAPGKIDVLGSLMLSMLAGHKRYTHINALRGDAVAAQALGMRRVVSEDALRRGLLKMEQESPEQTQRWMRTHLMESVSAALERPWILDIDASIKPLYGHQQGAKLGYNPKKPGRPSHVLHTYWVGNLRLVLDVEVSPGNKHSSAHAKTGLGRLLDELKTGGSVSAGTATAATAATASAAATAGAPGATPATETQAHPPIPVGPNLRPALVRGDCGFGNEGILIEVESREQPYLFRLRQTKNVQRLIERQFLRLDWSTPDAQGFQAVEDTLQLSGWSRKRRVIILRRQVRGDLLREQQNSPRQKLLAFGDPEVLPAGVDWEYVVLTTDVPYPIESIAQLYRDRCDCENGFDELKNQWGLSDFTTQDIGRCQTTARAGALVYNWWSWYCRAANHEARLEAITSRPLLLAAVGKATSHAGQTQLYLTPMHAKVDSIKALVANVHEALRHIKQSAQQLTSLTPWRRLIKYICDKITAIPPRRQPHNLVLGGG